jgi:hypothetical protein
MTTRTTVKRLLERVEAIAPEQPFAVVWVDSWNGKETPAEALARHLEARPDHRHAKVCFVSWLPPQAPPGHGVPASPPTPRVWTPSRLH